jgi:hypothetical protein
MSYKSAGNSILEWSTEMYTAPTPFVDPIIYIEDVALIILFTVIVIKGLTESLVTFPVDGWRKTLAYVFSYALVGILGFGIVASSSQCLDCELTFKSLASLIF